jgi:ATP-binding cassette subfamily C (CFTR/MRP) protein 1
VLECSIAANPMARNNEPEESNTPSIVPSNVSQIQLVEKQSNNDREQAISANHYPQQAPLYSSPHKPTKSSEAANVQRNNSQEKLPASEKPLGMEENPLIHANFLSILFFSWSDKLFSVGNKRHLELTDIWAQIPQNSVEFNSDKLRAEWAKELQLRPQNPSIFRALIRAFGRKLLVGGCVNFCYYVFYIFIPFLVPALTQWIANPNDNRTLGNSNLPLGVAYALAISACCLFSSLAINHSFYILYQVGSNVRSALMTAIYEKSLRLSASSRAASTTGETVNLMSNDVSRIVEAIPFCNNLWVSVTIIIIAMALLIWQIGVAAVAAVGLMVLMIPFQVYCGRKIAIYRNKLIKFTDERVKLMAEILNGIRIIKFYAWEIPIAEKISNIRAHELNFLEKSILIKALNLGLLFNWPAIVTFVTFAVYSLIGNTVNTQSVFLVLSFLTLIRFPVSLLPNAISNCADARSAFDRIGRFLLLEELPSHPRNLIEIVQNSENMAETSNSQAKVVQNVCDHAECGHLGSIRLRNGDFRWQKDSPLPTLQGVNLDVAPGQLVGVVGQVGAGKSSLLCGLLGEMIMQNASTEVCVNGRISYTPQKAFIRNATVRDNILFGLAYDRKLYKKCIAAAALEPDLAILTGGDQTEIGESGVTLSGGQKQRIGIARCFYRAYLTDIFMLDDIFSAGFSISLHVDYLSETKQDPLYQQSAIACDFVIFVL